MNCFRMYKICNFLIFKGNQNKRIVKELSKQLQVENNQILTKESWEKQKFNDEVDW